MVTLTNPPESEITPICTAALHTLLLEEYIPIPWVTPPLEQPVVHLKDYLLPGSPLYELIRFCKVMLQSRMFESVWGGYRREILWMPALLTIGDGNPEQRA